MGTNSFRESLHKQKKLIRVTLTGIAAVVLVFALLINFFNEFRNELILTQQKELLSMANMVGQSLSITVSEKVEQIDLYFSALTNEEDRRLSQYALYASHFYEQQESFYDGITCYDSEKCSFFSYGQMEFDTALLDKAEQNSTVICGKTLCSRGWYELFLLYTFEIGGEPYYLVSAMNLNELYDCFVAPVQIGNGGYSVVKDKDLSIIMHHAQSQIGMDAVYDRSEAYPEIDLTDLTRWIEMQKEQPQGYDVINSYRWDTENLTPERRIVAYTTITMQGETWIVNCTLPFAVLNEPIETMLVRLSFLTALLALTLCLLVFVYVSGTMRSMSQRKEIKYLREINSGMELLRRKDEELQHYQRIQTIGQMSSHIAHEFNNYLTPIMVYCGLLETDDSISEVNKTIVREMLKSTESAASLSRRLLDFSRQESSVVLKPMDLTQETQEALKVLRQMTPKAVTLKADITEAPLQIKGQKSMVDHILMNLFNNALHAMEEREEKILTISLQKETGTPLNQVAMDWAHLTVRDTGCGIHPDAISKIFEPFYTTKRSGKGTGLGLSVVHNMVVLAGGRVEVSSELNQGTTFHLYFPLDTGEARVQTERQAKRSQSARRIVVVDDNKEFLAPLFDLLRKHGYWVKCFEHPAIVLSKLQNQPDYCDLILTDYDMPSMDGLEFCQLTRKLNPEIRLILMSGVENSSFEWYLKNNFIDHFIAKTDISTQLLSLIAESTSMTQ